MNRLMITWILALILGLSVAGTGLTAPPPMIEQFPAGKEQKACPVQHGKINKDLYVDYKGQRIYFCCKECLPIFNKNPEAYLKRMEQEGVLPEKSPGGK